MSFLKKNSKLILLTSEFPYGTGETFIENEFPFLIQGFENIIIFSESNKGESRIQSNQFPVHLINSINWSTRIASLFNREFYIELKYLWENRKLSLSTFRTAWYSLSKSRTISKQLESFDDKNDCIFYSYWLDEKAIALALLKKKHPTIKALSRAHGWDVYEERHPNGYLPYRKMLLESLDCIYAISESGKSYFAKKYLESSEKIRIGRLGTWTLNRSPKKTTESTFHVLSISSIIPLKRVEKILELVSSMPNFNIKWTHIGGGPSLESIKTMATKKSEQYPKFTFELLGQKSNEEVRNFLSTNFVDLFINLSVSEGIPVSIMEVQSVSIPVLATMVGGTSEIVNSDNGFLVDKDFEMEEAVSIIENYLESSKDEIQKKRLASYENWKQHYNAEVNYKVFLEAIKRP